MQINQIPQIRVNKVFKDVLSSWWNVDLQADDENSKKIELLSLDDKNLDLS